MIEEKFNSPKKSDSSEKPQDKEQLKVIGKGEIIIGNIIDSERMEVEKFMKECACESREDNSWQKDYNKDYHIVYWDTGKFDTCSDECCSLNVAYFSSDEDAQSCLDKLIEKYGEEKLREIWGVKNNELKVDKN